MVSHGFTHHKASAAARGYDKHHRAVRAAYQRTHHPANPCTRCHLPLGPWGPRLHLDHNNTRTGYLGMAHAHCNSSAGATAANLKRHQARHATPRRAW